ncbi:hypothetical protein, partial [Aggregatibacter actinomycetemcomitans]|uniref:hypothetical protein n=1 Tax=Aggregatibacter actinomycetemcomitans TaxID=714 RepID=UPI001CA37F66
RRQRQMCIRHPKKVIHIKQRIDEKNNSRMLPHKEFASNNKTDKYIECKKYITIHKLSII